MGASLHTHRNSLGPSETWWLLKLKTAFVVDVLENEKMIVLQSKVGFSPDLESTRLWERDFKRQATLGQTPAISEYGLQVLGVSCSLLTCAALRMICCSRHH